MMPLELESVETELEQPEGLRTYREAIAAAFFEYRDRLDIRYLWTRGTISTFRVNWWTLPMNGQAGIRRSAFVQVERTDAGLVVHDNTLRRAA